MYLLSEYSEVKSTKQAGFSYIGLLIAVAIMSALLAQVAVFWHQAVQREKERELLAIGDEFRTAITRYYEDSSGPQKIYPTQFDDLLEDKRVPNVRRYLRKLYHDPITGSTEWGIIKGPGGSIAGVYSLSDQAPLKIANFGTGDEGFAKKKHYSEWQFVYAAGAPLAIAPSPDAAPDAVPPPAPATALPVTPSADATAQPAQPQNAPEPTPATANPDARKAYICRVFHSC